MGDLLVRLILLAVVTLVVGASLVAFLGVNKLLAYAIGFVVGLIGATRSGVKS